MRQRQYPGWMRAGGLIDGLPPYCLNHDNVPFAGCCCGLAMDITERWVSSFLMLCQALTAATTVFCQISLLRFSLRTTLCSYRLTKLNFPHVSTNFLTCQTSQKPRGNSFTREMLRGESELATFLHVTF